MSRTITMVLIGAVVALVLFAGAVVTGGERAAAQLDRTPVWATQTAEAISAQATAAAAPPTPPQPSPGDQSAALRASITLRAPGAPGAAWTIVQWSDRQDGWYDVTGWQGDFDDGTQKVWVVFPEDYGTGPFRWVVYTGRGGIVWGISEPFFLPDGPGSWVEVAVSAAAK